MSAMWARAYSPMIRRIRRRAFLGVGLVTASAAAEAIGLATLGVAAVGMRHTTTEALLIACAIAGSLALAVFTRAASEWQLAQAQVDLERGLRVEITDTILRCDWQDFVDQPGHELQSAALAEAPQVSQATLTFIRGCGQTTAAVVIFSAAFLVSPVAAGICTAFGIPLALLYRRSSRGLREVQERLAKGNQEITRKTMILVNGLRSLRLSPVQEQWREDVTEVFSEHAQARRDDLTIPIRGRLLVDGLAIAMILVVLVVQQLLHGALLPGLIVMALILRVTARLQGAQQHLAFAENGVSWLRRWQDRLEELGGAGRPVPGDNRIGVSAEPTRAASSGGTDNAVLSLKNVGFSYRGHDRPVLRGVDLDIGVGEWVSLRGPSGQGKSTLVDIIGGILTPQQGSVQFCGRDLESYRRSELYRRLAVVPQDVYLVGTTVRDILCWGEAHTVGAEVDEITAALGVDHMFSFGGDRAGRVDELSRDISGGMRTRLAMARALVAGPDLLLLDESTARLHPAAEAQVFEAIRRLRPDLSVLVVTHRVETTAGVDRRLVLRDGRLSHE